ncbi:O-antigen ligase domain-containing protein [Grimontia hollisae]|uniref:Capsular polysaccharide synthesis enzyme cpsG Lipid A core-O-antigen ligase n=1 Tax=Grimontia hollisae CIP 101886 TaxID=675812 RepID=D0I561_GRIHO|nr:O-antigen ligase family protein [Grimontia hollisae]AUW37813.1 O-antigen ligase domain-containing protein [Grimontia hollisae]EEY73628.1 capsular polysaccharide synthesis enzyme cpsG Lipid A core - O-antigen ligase [Grimontia hollisae CIP 101886]STO42208.1 Lipid A core - O-antigen ligase and related enzymes [Grimontia hollisae]
MIKPLEHAAALAVVLFFVPMKVTVAGISLYLADLVGIMALGFLGLTACRGQLLQSTVRASGFILVFVAYIALAGVVSNVPVKLVLIEMVQWLSVAAFLGVLHQAGLLASPRFLTLVTVYTFLGALYTAGWHLMYSTVRDFKQLENTKYFFGFTCALLYILRRQIRFGHLMLAIAMVMLLMSGERKALMGVAALVICDFLFCREISHPRSQQTAVALGILGLLGGGLALVSGWYLAGTDALLDTFEFTQFDILFADQQEARWDSELWRKLLLANGFSLFLEYPVFGVGPKMLPMYIANYFQNQELAIYTHNFVLDVAIEYGLVGLAILIGGFLLGLRRLFRQRFVNPVAFLLAVYILAMVLFVAVNSTIMLMFLFPFFVNTRVVGRPEPSAPATRSFSLIAHQEDKQ